LAIPTRYAPRRAHVPYWWILATAVAALIAIGPVAAAVFVSLTGGGAARTAFAAAPAGDYAVLVRPEAESDVVVAVPAAGGAAADIAKVPRLPGYTSYGAVSPDGRRVALVTADGGTQSRPVATLLVVELDTGRLSRLAEGVDYLQTPVWAPDGTSIVVSRTGGGDGPAVGVSILRVGLSGAGEQVVAEARDVLGAYPVGFDGAGRLVHVAVEARGSVAYRDGLEVVVLARGITRDWRLSPDGTHMAFVETSTASGVRYYGRIVALEGGAEAFAQSADVQSLGVAWRPGSGAATFGVEPGGAATDNAAHAQARPGFDIPLGYSADGRLLVVQRWSGTSFAAPGDASLEIVGPDGGRTALDGYGRFYGWATK
jgi:hypothetical protein